MLGVSFAIHVSQLHSLVDYLPLGGRWKGFTLRVSVSSSITYHVLSLCLHLSSLNLFHLISAVDVILIGLDCLSIIFYAYVHIPHINCLTLSLN